MHRKAEILKLRLEEEKIRLKADETQDDEEFAKSPTKRVRLFSFTLL